MGPVARKQPHALGCTAEEAAAELGIAVSELLLYENRGLIAPERCPDGSRRFRPHDIERARSTVRLRDRGVDLTVAKCLLGDGSANIARTCDEGF